MLDQIAIIITRFSHLNHYGLQSVHYQGKRTQFTINREVFDVLMREEHTPDHEIGVIEEALKI